MAEQQPTESRPQPRPWRRRALWLLVCLGLLALFSEPLLLALLPRLADAYVNGRVTADEIEWLPDGGGVVLRGLTVSDTTGQTLLTADRVRLQMALSPLRLGAVEIDSAVLQVDLADWAATWLRLMKERPDADTAPVRLPDHIRVAARLDLRNDTWTRTVGLELQTSLMDGVTRGQVKLRDLTSGRAELAAAGDWLAATGALTGLTVVGGLRGDSTFLLLTAQADYDPARGLRLREARVSDGIDTVSVSGTCCGDSTFLRLQARDFSFGSRYPELSWAGGELLDLSLQGNQRLVRVSGNYRAGRSSFALRGEIEPGSRRARLEQAGGWLPRLGNFTASGEAWQDTALPGWRWRDVTATSDRFPMEIEGAAGSWSDSDEIVTSARSFRYERYRLEEPAGAAVWQEGRLAVSRLAAGGLQGRLLARGNIDILTTHGEIKISAARLQLAAIDRIFRREFDPHCKLRAGAISGEVGVKWGGGWRVTLRQLQLAGAAAQLPGLGEVAGLAADGELDIDGRALIFRRLDCRWLGGSIGVQGALPWSGEATLNITARGVALAQVDQLLRDELARQQLVLSAGTLDASAVARFGGGSWSVSVPALACSGAGFGYAPLGSVRGVEVRGALELAPGRVVIRDLRGTLLGGLVIADGSYAGGIGALTVTGENLKLAEIDTLLRAQLAQQQMRLFAGTLNAGLRLASDSAGWSAVTTSPVALRGLRFSHGQTGIISGLDLTVEGEAKPRELAVRQLVATLPAGTVRANLHLTGEKYEMVRDGEIVLVGLQLDQLADPLTQLLQPDYGLSELGGRLDGNIRLADTDGGGLRISGALDFADANLSLSEPDITVSGLHGRLKLSGDEARIDAEPAYDREGFAEGWQAMAGQFVPDITCAEIRVGSIKLVDLRLAGEVHWPAVAVHGASWNMFGGSGRARGLIAAPGRPGGFSALFDNVSTRRICAGFPGIEDYLGGKLRTVVGLRGDTMTVTAWMYDGEDERMGVSRAMLVRIGGETVRNQLPESRPNLPLDAGELTMRIAQGRMHFDLLRLEINRLLERVRIRVGVVKGNDEYGLQNFLRVIKVIGQRGVQSEVRY